MKPEPGSSHEFGVVVPLREWNDGRLNDLSKRVEGIDRRLEPVLTLVAAQSVKLDTLTDDFKDVKSGIGDIHTELKEMRGDPIKDKRTRRQMLTSATVSAAVGGIFVIIATLLSGIHI